MIYKHSNFTGNVAESSGGAMVVNTGGITIQGNAWFARNTAYMSGGALWSYNPNFNINGNLSLESNKAKLGGAMYVSNGNLIIQGNTSFDENFAKDSGGALYISRATFKFYGSTYYRNNTSDFGGALYIINSAKILFDGKLSTYNAISFIIFIHNIANFAGGAIYCDLKCGLRFVGTVYFLQNFHNAIRIIDSIATFVGHSSFYRTVGAYGGAIEGSDSNLTFSGTVYFEKNKDYLGGAIFLEGASKLIFKPELDISFVQNYASSGGALFFRDSQCLMIPTVRRECSIAIELGSLFAPIRNISLRFVNNSANVTGSDIYGGHLFKCKKFIRASSNPDHCYHNPADGSCSLYDALKTLLAISTIDQYSNSTLSISSPAEEIRFCQDDEGSDRVSKQVHPGQYFNISLIALGQTNSPVPTRVFWTRKYAHLQYYLNPSSQPIGSLCTSISFQLLHSANRSGLIFKLYPENPCQSLFQGEPLFIYINVLPCPFGFNLVGRCVCDKKLKKFVQNCYIVNDSESVERMANNYWVSKISNETLILHEFRCPLDYCNEDILNVSLSDPSDQCDFNRNGILCGKCQKNFSLTLGSLHCIPCDNNHTTLILFFALAGVALIATIFLLHLTTAAGTVNGLFFYANIIQANHQAFFPRANINFFTVFTSLLNLDFGIETCFYDGMDIYAYSWFQFLFPFYIWFLVGCIIVASRYSRSIAKRFGQNPVAVLATLFLMSYSKLLQAIIVPLSWTYLTYYTPSKETRSIVWLYDASVHFFKEPKHIALGFFAITSLVVLVLPYIFLLLFSHWLQGCSNWWILSWLNKLKPFMDAYHAPYKKHTRYWTGLLLLSRLGLFLTFAINANGSESINILAASSVSLALLAIHRRVYEQWWKDLLESSFILNLGIFSVTTFYLKEESDDANR